MWYVFPHMAQGQSGETIPRELEPGDEVVVEYTERVKREGQIKKEQIERSFTGDVVGLGKGDDVRQGYRYVDVDTDGDGELDRRVFRIGSVIEPTGTDNFDARDVGIWADVQLADGGDE